MKKQIVIFLILAIFEYSCSDTRYIRKKTCNCVFQNNITFDSIVMYKAYSFGAMAMGYSNPKTIKQIGDKNLISDSDFLTQSRNLFFRDCDFKHYIDQPYSIDLVLDPFDKQGAYGQVIEIYFKKDSSNRIIQIITDSYNYNYVGNNKDGKCRDLIREFVTLEYNYSQKK